MIMGSLLFGWLLGIACVYVKPRKAKETDLTTFVVLDVGPIPGD
jgi:hypothetical protein